MDGLEQVLRLISYVATPIIAIGAVVIAWQQALINRQKLVLDRYDRRLRIYQHLKELLSKITAHGKATDQEVNQITTFTSGLPAVRDRRACRRAIRDGLA
jgi:hypothetical protein